MAIHGRSALGLAILVPVILFAGCPLVSDYPLSDPKAASIDRSLVGKWTVDDPGANERGIVTFLPFDEHELVGFARDEAPGKTDAYRAFTTEVGGERFLNARELDSGPAGWYLLRYRVEGSVLRMTLVDDGLFKGAGLSASAELLDFVRRNIEDPKLYAPGIGETANEITWTRAAD